MATLRSVSGPALRQPQGNHPDSTNALWERIGYYESESAYLQKKLEASEAFRDQLMEALLNKTKEVRVVIEHGKDRKRDFSSEREEWSSQRDKLEERVTKLERKLIALKSTLVAERENAKTLKTKLGMALVVIQSMLAAKCDPNSVPTQQLLDLLQPDEAIDIRTPSLTPEKSATSSSRMNSGEFNSTSSSTEIGSLKLEDVNKVLNDYNEKHLFVTSDEELDAEVVTAVEEAVKHGTPQITNKSYIHYSFDNPSTTEVKNASFSNVTQSSSDSSKDEEGEVSSASAMPRSLTPAPKRSLVAEVASALGTTEDTFAVATAIRRNINAPGYGALARPAVPQYPRVNRRGIYHDYHDYDASIEVPRFAPRAASAPTAGFGCEEVIGDNY